MSPFCGATCPTQDVCRIIPGPEKRSSRPNLGLSRFERETWVCQVLQRGKMKETKPLGLV